MLRRILNYVFLTLFVGMWAYWKYNNSTTVETPSVEEIIPEEPAPVSFPAPSATYLLPEVIHANDVNTFKRLKYMGKGMRTTYDGRIENDTIINAYLFNAYYEDGHKTEIQISPEFQDVEQARQQAERFGKVYGLLPNDLRREVKRMTVFKTGETMFGDPFHVYLSASRSDSLEKDGILEEIMLHEAGHAALDVFYAPTDDWKESQQLDGRFISDYAEEFPDREDLTISFLFFIAAKYRSDRLDAELVDSIKATIPHRIAFFEQLNLDVYPIVPRGE